MGDPRKHRKKYQTPGTAWSKSRIEEEAELVKEFGFKNKKEIWKVESLLRKFARKAKDLIPSEGKQAEIETKHLLEKLASLGLLEPNSQLDKVLDINLKSLAERRLQSQVYKKGFAKSVKQARQFITHRHVLINNKVITSPSYLVSKKEESLIKFLPTSALAQLDHPERVQKKEEIKEEVKQVKPKSKKTKTRKVVRRKKK